jgi:hypothetical protein
VAARRGATAWAILLAGATAGARDGCGSAEPEIRPEARPVATACVRREDCDDGVVCNGVEDCLAGFCTSARNAACRDPGGCAEATCDEAAGGCRFAPDDGRCEGAARCEIGVGCRAAGCSADLDCDDRRACTLDRCVDGRCLNWPRDAVCPPAGACGVGVCLGDEVADPSGCGIRPDAARCATDEGCDLDGACVTLRSACDHDRDCRNGSLCDGVERCVEGRCVHGDRTTCQARDRCHHAICRVRAAADPWCLEVALPGCPDL